MILKNIETSLRKRYLGRLCFNHLLYQLYKDHSLESCRAQTDRADRMNEEKIDTELQGTLPAKEG